MTTNATNRSIISIIFLLLVIIFQGCGNEVPKEVHQTVTLDGATVAIDGIEIVFPPNSISNESVFSVSVIDNDEALSLKPQGAELVSDMFKLELEDGTILDEIYLTFPLEDFSSYDSENLFVALNQNDTWTTIPSFVDTEAGVVRAVASHFSLSGVFYDAIGRKPKIESISPQPCPYIYKSDTFSMDRDILWEVLVEDPYQRVQKAVGNLRIYTLKGDLVAEAALDIGGPWRWPAELVGEKTSGGVMVGQLKKSDVNDVGLTSYKINTPLSEWDFRYGDGVSKLRFDVTLETDGAYVEETYTLEVSGGERDYFNLVSPENGAVVERSPTFVWETNDPLNPSKQQVELHICPNQDLRHRPVLGIFGGCEKLRLNDIADGLDDEVPKLNRRKWWWGLVVYGDSITGGNQESYRTCGNQFTVVEDASSNGGLESITGDVIAEPEQTPEVEVVVFSTETPSTPTPIPMPTATPLPTNTPTPVPTITPAPTLVSVENEDDFCAPLRGPNVLASETFGDEFLCGNFVLNLLESGDYWVSGRYAVDENLDPFGTGEFAINTICIQVDNLTTGELGEASCSFGGASSREFEGRGPIVGVSPPLFSSGDTLRVSMWVFEVVSRTSNNRIGLDPNDQEVDWPDTIDGRDMMNRDGKHGCFWGMSEPCSFAQDIQAVYPYQKTFEVP
ncbi:hypothetical protein ACFLXQ_01550 [Chloroflexota bacterium]